MPLGGILELSINKFDLRERPAEGNCFNSLSVCCPGGIMSLNFPELICSAIYRPLPSKFFSTWGEIGVRCCLLIPDVSPAYVTCPGMELSLSYLVPSEHRGVMASRCP